MAYKISSIALTISYSVWHNPKALSREIVESEAKLIIPRESQPCVHYNLFTKYPYTTFILYHRLYLYEWV